MLVQINDFSGSEFQHFRLSIAPNSCSSRFPQLGKASVSGWDHRGWKGGELEKNVENELEKNERTELEKNVETDLGLINVETDLGM